MRIARLTIALFLLLAINATAFAERKDPLDDKPARLPRVQLRDTRFEIGPSIQFSVDRALRHAFLFGLRAQYHINDYFSLGADVGFGVGVDTGLKGEIESQKVPASLGGGDDWSAIMNNIADIQMAGDVRATFTPFSGKMAVFGKAFFAYDFYVFAGFGFAMTKNNSDIPGVDEANEGFRPGFAWGAGLQMFFTDWFSTGIEIRDLLFSDNESGGDLTRGQSDTELAQSAVLIDGDDKELTHHFFLGVNFTFFFPLTPSVSMTY
ncbi:MAG: outer membrane beta-barrel domain-containing protein [Deltaproteobacteria bacterium]|nr:outer membrane beta-barrel domain-containing protein [Deltaproteobacteria bacterium]